MFVEGDATESDVRRDRNVDHALGLAADAAVGDGVKLSVDASVGGVEVRLVRNDADGARFARCAVKRALRTGEALDSGYVVDMDVERPADGRHRLLVEVGADRWQ